MKPTLLSALMCTRYGCITRPALEIFLLLVVSDLFFFFLITLTLTILKMELDFRADSVVRGNKILNNESFLKGETI